MKYKFSKVTYSDPSIETTWQFGVEVFDKNLKALEQIESFAWTSAEAQKLIDECEALQGSEELEYQVYGGHLFIIIDKQEVYFYNLLNGGGEADFIWSYNQFIDFMQKFKSFLLENNV